MTDHKISKNDIPIILYFGDLDPKGVQIPLSAKNDITEWVKLSVERTDGSAPFKWIRCGLNQEHIEQFDLPIDYEKPRYQWEALSDEQAREIIVGALDKYVDPDAIKEKWRTEDKWSALLQEHMKKQWYPTRLTVKK